MLSVARHVVLLGVLRSADLHYFGGVPLLVFEFLCMLVSFLVYAKAAALVYLSVLVVRFLLC